MSNNAIELMESNEFVINKVLDFMKTWYPDLPLEEISIHARFTIDEKSFVNVNVDWENDGTQSVSTRTYIKRNVARQLYASAVGEDECQ